MLEFAEAQNERNRHRRRRRRPFQRSFKESVLIDEYIAKGKGRTPFLSGRNGNQIGASSTDILRWDFSVMGAKHMY